MRTLPGFDDLKRSLGEYLGGSNPTVQDAAVKPIRDAIVQSITAKHPGYSEMMQNYADASDALKDMRSMAGSAKMAPVKQFAKIFNTYKKGAGSNLVEQFAAKDPTLPYELAGHALHEWTPGGLRNIIEGSSGVLGAFHDPSSIPSFVGAAAASSPRLMGNLNYGAGALSKVLPPPKTISRLGATQNDTQPQVAPAYAKGGAVRKRMSHEQLVQRLMDASEEAKKATKRDTKAILGVPDNVVAKALATARRAI
jgi:hypothetical protein